MADVGISLEALLVLLFTVFAVPGACFCVCLGLVIRGMIRGRRIRKAHQRSRTHDIKGGLYYDALAD